MDARRAVSALWYPLLSNTTSPDSVAMTPHRDIWRIAAPMILSNLSVPLLGLVDTAVVGHLEHSWYLGAVAVGAAIFSFLYNGVNFLRMGTTGVAAQGYGAGDAVVVHRSLREALLVALGIAVAFIALHPFIREIALALVQPEAEVRSEAGTYINIRIWSAPATLASYVMIGWFLGLQNARAPLLIVLVINLSNIALDLFFVIGLGMKTAGVALASVAAEYLGLSVAIVLALRELRGWPAQVSWSNLLSLASYKRYFTVNGNIFVRTMALMFTLFFMTAQSARLGTVVLAANAILINLQMVISYGLDALAHAAEALVGKTEGQRDRQAMAAIVRRVFAWAAGFALVIAAVFLLGGEFLIGLLTSIDAVEQTAIAFLFWLVISPLVSVWSFVYDGVFIGATRAREMRNVMVASAFMIFIPVWWLTLSFGNNGLWFAFTMFMVARALGMHYYYLKILREPCEPLENQA